MDILQDVRECNHCTQAFLFPADRDQEYVCSACITDMAKECHSCSKITLDPVAGPDKDENGNEILFCERCFRDEFFICQSCENSGYQDNAREGPDGALYCETCFDERYTVCDYCGGTVHSYDAVRSAYREHICQDCLQEDYFFCENCNVLAHQRYGHYTDSGVFCESCADEVSRSIMDHDTKPEPVFFRAKNEKKAELYFGVELEVEVPNHRTLDDVADNVNNHLFYSKYDCSISHGFEIITHPFSWNYLLENMGRFDTLFNTLADEQCDADDTTTCGMHVHISKNAFSTLHLFKFLELFYSESNLGRILEISERPSLGKLAEWAHIEGDTKADYIQKARRKRHHNKFEAVNLCNPDTVEIRVFRGTILPKTFLKNLEFVKAVYEFTRNSSLSHNTWRAFRNFVTLNRKTYINLYNFLKARRI